MKTSIENVEMIKKVNGRGQEIIQVFDKEKWNGVSKGARIYTTPTSVSDVDIIEDVNFQIDADQDTKNAIAKMIVSMK